MVGWANTQWAKTYQKHAMKYASLPFTRTVCFVAVTAFAVMNTVQAQPAPMAMPVTATAQPDAHNAMMGSDSMKKSMMAGMDGMQKMAMTGDTDKDFAMMMKMHHQQGVDMAQMQIDHGKSPVMKKMAKQIMAAQNKEIRQFDKWLATQK